MNENISVAEPGAGRQQGPVGPPVRPGGSGTTALRGIGELLLTIGLVLLLFVFYEIYVTGWFSAGKQDEVTRQLENQWQNQRGSGIGPIDGQALARLYIPALGPDYHFTVVEGTSAHDLDIGPGHYTGTALPGGRGNFAVAGHRVGKGSPFNDLDLVQSCDAIVVETQQSWFVYRMLPKTGEMPGWSTGRGRTPNCAGANDSPAVAPLGPSYANLPGQQIVLPSQSSVIDPVPGLPDSAIPPGNRLQLITLTTCHPQFSDRERLILHGALVKVYAKGAPNQLPPELKESS